MERVAKLKALMPWLAIPALAGTPLAIGRGFYLVAMALGLGVIPTYLLFRKLGEVERFRWLVAGAAVVALAEAIVASALGRNSGVLVMTGLAWVAVVSVLVLRILVRPSSAG